ncbi:MAG: adenosine deaminase [Candidatus Bathyarchaeota archaeon]|nr:MAG: adenosine deaminase [Candidatus Bathyarchaeota archaeon]
MNVTELIKALAKVEQHVHIVGSVRPETLFCFANQADIEMPFKTVEEVHEFFRFRDFPHFISVYTMVVNCITEESQFERITYEMLEGDARNNVHYVEASFSPADHVFKDLEYNRMLKAINNGIRRAQADFGIKCNIRIDLVRNYGPEIGMEVLNWIEGENDNVVSIDIGGSEHKYPPKPFEQVYSRANEMGLHLVAHAGEAAGPQSVWDAVKYLNVEHIGHGLAAVNDNMLMEYLLKRGITVEMCPTSNIKTGAISSLERHPIRTFLRKGLKVTVNTDDPSMFGTSMNDEYLQLHSKLNFTIPELFSLSLDAVDSSFLPEKLKMSIRETFMKEYHNLEIE